MRAAPLLLLTAFTLAACGETATLSVDKGQGANPELPAPKKTPLPTVKVADATGWPAGERPTAARGLKVTAFAAGLDHPRWLYVLPNGDVLVAESNAPPKPKDNKGIRGLVMGLVMKKAGAATKSANRITLLRDADGDGHAEVRSTFLTGLMSPFGMALTNGRLYIANADAVVSVPYANGDLKASAAPVRLTDLPGGPINHHWTKSLMASKDGRFLYAGIGSNSNVGENGLNVEKDRAAILEIDIATGQRKVFASGLRNPVGMDWNPATGELWVAVNERDEIGSDLVPDYMTSVRRGGFYGWPWSYYGPHIDERVQPPNPDRVSKAIRPDYALGPHTASLGLAFYTADALPQYKGGVFVGQHGSWNRNPPSGYKVIFVPFNGDQPSGPPQDVLTGFLKDGKARGRPVGVAVDAHGAILVADDVGNIIWRVAK
ncbi:sorbosone dehydrogenase family protein [Asticcacaulis sp. AND118]|uniref:PQQ-dependent sugar dehydrogenase n=1 Tax=Asticcacaulis sp. AND118 TaxID=2840468 RepID=UPI001CFF63BA|nr:sorbosone dehydrogenase family protein [Asticcacaulis sp. AND118]UDF02806.1 sorbosone dehydrogenase family protein [Asticcacaulis sp. AND118]